MSVLVITIGELALSSLDALSLLEVVVGFALATDLLDLLVMLILYPDHVVDQVMVVVVVLDNDTLCVPVVTDDVGDHGFDVLVMDDVLLDNRLGSVEVERDCAGDCWLLVSEECDCSLDLRRLGVTRVVW